MTRGDGKLHAVEFIEPRLDARLSAYQGMKRGSGVVGKRKLREIGSSLPQEPHRLLEKMVLHEEYTSECDSGWYGRERVAKSL